MASMSMRATAIALVSCAIASQTLADDSKCHTIDDSTSLLQQTMNFKSGKSDISAQDPKLGPPYNSDTAIVPPVHIGRQDKIAELGTVSTPGSWKGYYNMAENSMDAQWPKIYPMIRGSNFGQVIEVAAGACRNTEKLVPLASHVLVTDIDPTAVDSCRHRFKSRPEANSKLSFAVVDGVHLPAANESIDLIYQFDSGVHFHQQVIRGYLSEFKRVLRPGGTGFFHHSNLAASPFPVMDGLDVTQNMAWRSNMSSALFEQFARDAGLEMLCHPVVTWAGQRNLDALARFRKPGGPLPEEEKCPDHLEF